MKKLITKTVYHDMLASSLMLNKRYNPMKGSTLNEAFNIKDTSIPDGVPNLNMIVLGKTPTVVNTSIDKYDYYISPINAALIDHIPLKHTKVSVGLSSTDTDRYRLRTEKTIDGILYEFYYGMVVMDSLSNSDGSVLLQPTDNRFVVSEFIADDYDAIHPVPVDEPTYDNIRYVATSNTFNVDLTSDVLNNIYEAHKLLHGTEDVVIGEIGICSSIDSNRTVTTPYKTYTYKESLFAQLMFVVKNNMEVKDSSGRMNPLNIGINIGGLDNIIVPSIVREVSEWSPIP